MFLICLFLEINSFEFLKTKFKQIRNNSDCCNRSKPFKQFNNNLK